MRYALIYEHKVSVGQRGIISLFDLEADAMTAAADNAKLRPDFNYFVCPMQTQVSGDVAITTTVIAATVAAPTVQAAPSNPAPAAIKPGIPV